MKLKVKRITQGLASAILSVSLISSFIVAGAEEYYKSLTYEKHSDYIGITGCDETQEAVQIPDSISGIPVKAIEYHAFGNCKSIKCVTLPTGSESIGDWAFYNCTGITVINIQDGLTALGTGAFGGCKSLTDISLPPKITDIKYRAFAGCENLVRMDIPSSAEQISDQAFYGCKSLSHAVLPESVTSVGAEAFADCGSLKDIIFENPKCEIYDSEYTISNTSVIYGYAGSTAQSYAEKYGREFIALASESEYSISAPEGLRCFDDCNGDIDTQSLKDDIMSQISVTDSNGEPAQISLKEMGISGSTGTVYIISEGSVIGELSVGINFRGDINKDGKITAADASVLFSEYKQQYKSGESSFSDKDMLYGDTNFDGKITAVDASYAFSKYKKSYRGY